MPVPFAHLQNIPRQPSMELCIVREILTRKVRQEEIEPEYYLGIFPRILYFQSEKGDKKNLLPRVIVFCILFSLMAKRKGMDIYISSHVKEFSQKNKKHVQRL